MSLIALVLLACVGSFSVGGLALAAYASLPEKFWDHAELGRYAGLTASAVGQNTPTNRVPPVHMESLPEAV
jgi:hypothetical protein